MPKGVITGLVVAGSVLLVVLGIRAYRKAREEESTPASAPRLGVRPLRSGGHTGTIIALARDRANLAASEVAGVGGRYPT